MENEKLIEGLVEEVAKVIYQKVSSIGIDCAEAAKSALPVIASYYEKQIAELKAQTQWLPASEAPKGIPVLVHGGIAMRKTGDEWFSGMEEPLFQRKIEWEVTHFMNLPKPPTE